MIDMEQFDRIIARAKLEEKQVLNDYSYLVFNLMKENTYDEDEVLIKKINDLLSKLKSDLVNITRRLIYPEIKDVEEELELKEEKQ